MIANKENSNIVVIGLTGGIGSGKSAVCEFIKQYYHFLIDADIVSRNVMGFDFIIKKIKKLFPQCFFNNELDRKQLRKIVFEDISLLQKLNTIVMPSILDSIKKTLSFLNINNDNLNISNDKNSNFYNNSLDYMNNESIIKKNYNIIDNNKKNNKVLLVAPLLFETKLHTLCNKVICISCSDETKKQRVMKRDNISEKLFFSILSQQLEDSEREKNADYIIENNGSIDMLKDLAEKIQSEINRLYDKKVIN